MKPSDITIIKRDVEGLLIPYGDKINLVPGTEVLVTQALGSSFTLNVNGNLVRIEGKDADAIGRKPIDMPVDRYEIKEDDTLNEEVLWEQMRTCYDPEIPVNVVDLGLIYELSFKKLEKGYHVFVHMTLTAPGCGMGPVLSQEIEQRLLAVPNVKKADVILIFDPPWNADMMSEVAKLELGVL